MICFLSSLFSDGNASAVKRGGGGVRCFLFIPLLRLQYRLRGGVKLVGGGKEERWDAFVYSRPSAVVMLCSSNASVARQDWRGERGRKARILLFIGLTMVGKRKTCRRFRVIKYEDGRKWDGMGGIEELCFLQACLQQHRPSLARSFSCLRLSAL